ncbi:hypothetical protein Bca101_019965 [Brassica carinata]
MPALLQGQNMWTECSFEELKSRYLTGQNREKRDRMDEEIFDSMGSSVKEEDPDKETRSSYLLDLRRINSTQEPGYCPRQEHNYYSQKPKTKERLDRTHHAF